MSNNIQRRQTRLFMGILGVFVVGLGGLAYYIINDDIYSQTSEQVAVLPIDKSNPQDLWMARIEDEKQKTEKKVKILEKILIEKTKNEVQKEQENQLLKENFQRLKDEVKQELLNFKENSNSKSQYANSEVNYSNGQNQNFISYTNDPFAHQKNRDEETLQTPRLPLTELIISDVQDQLQHVDRTIPAGTSVRAILVSSVDMPCGISGPSDPQPIKLRLVDDARLPKKVRVKLKGGILIASAYGDLSNERIYIRLERLTQVRSDGKFIETGVAGFVSGEDGKYGIKGDVVDKSYRMVENAALSGLFSGINDYLQASVSHYNEPEYQISVGGLASSGANGGASNAFDMLTNYYIRRAEQIRPVIQASAGRLVDVTFIHSAELGDLYVQDKVREIRAKNRDEKEW